MQQANTAEARQHGHSQVHQCRFYPWKHLKQHLLLFWTLVSRTVGESASHHILVFAFAQLRAEMLQNYAHEAQGCPDYAKEPSFPPVEFLCFLVLGHVRHLSDRQRLRIGF